MLNQTIKNIIFKIIGAIIIVSGIIMSSAQIRSLVLGHGLNIQFVVLCLSVFSAGCLFIATGSETTQKLRMILALLAFGGFASLPIFVVSQYGIIDPVYQISRNPLMFVPYGIVAICILVTISLIAQIPLLTLRLKDITRMTEQQYYRLTFYEEDPGIITDEPVIYFYDIQTVEYFKLNRIYKINRRKISNNKTLEPDAISKYSKSLNGLVPKDFVLQDVI